jgi:hypothetical protein
MVRWERQDVGRIADVLLTVHEALIRGMLMNLRGENARLGMYIEGGHAIWLQVPRFDRVRTTKIPKLYITIQAVEPMSHENYCWRKEALFSDLADKMPPDGCHRTFWTQDVCSEYVLTIEPSSSNRRSNILTTPSAKLATKVWDDPWSEEIAVTGLSELVSKSFQHS